VYAPWIRPLSLLGVWLVASIVFAVRAVPTWGTVVDDAYISARYAEHFAAGWGLVYNAGEPPVEGFTNPLWTITLAGLIRLGVPLHAGMEGMGYVFGLLGLLGVVLLSDRLAGSPDRPWLVGVPAVFLAATPHYTVISTNGLETSQFLAWTLWTFAAIWAPGRLGRLAAAVLVGTLVWVRPEGALVAAGALLFDGIERRQHLRNPWTWAPAVAGVGSFLSMQAWRYVTYGAWVPNTAAAKGDLSWTKALTINAKYVGGDADFWIPFAVLLVAAVVFTRWSWKKAALLSVLLGLTIIASRIYLWMPGSRLLVLPMALALPILALPLQELRKALTWRTVAAGAVSVGFVGLLLYTPWGWTTTFQRSRDQRHSVLPLNPARLAGAHLQRHLPEGSWLATRDAGLLAWSVGTKVRVAELHERALTQPHPGGADADVTTFCPPNPEVVAFTVNTSDRAPLTYYPRERRLWGEWSARYHYLGRVEQHYRRHYDIYVREDLKVPPLDPAWVTNFRGLIPRTEPRGSALRSPDSAPQHDDEVP
jgi:hypothetical protein